jgi:hypothetical protein
MRVLRRQADPQVDPMLTDDAVTYVDRPVAPAYATTTVVGGRWPADPGRRPAVAGARALVALAALIPTTRGEWR